MMLRIERSLPETISKARFMNYRKVQMSGKRNMFGYDMGIQRNYEKCFKHFIEDKKDDPLVVTE